MNEGSGNTAIVAIIAIVILVGAVLYFMGVFTPKGDSKTTIERPNINIESPANSTRTR